MTVQKSAQTEMGSRFELFGAFLKIGSDPRLTWIVEDLLLEQYCEHLDAHEEIEIELVYERLLQLTQKDKRIERILEVYLSILKEVAEFYDRHGYHPTPFSPHYDFEDGVIKDVTRICTDLISAAFPRAIQADSTKSN